MSGERALRGPQLFFVSMLYKHVGTMDGPPPGKYVMHTPSQPNRLRTPDSDTRRRRRRQALAGWYETPAP